MKAAITVKVKGGYVTFPYIGPVTLEDISKTEVVSTRDYNYSEKVGGVVVDMLKESEAPGE